MESRIDATAEETSVNPFVFDEELNEYPDIKDTDTDQDKADSDQDTDHEHDITHENDSHQTETETETDEKEPDHKLHDSWTIWYHPINCDDWSASSYRLIGQFDTIEMFWSHMNHIQEMVLSGDMVVLMKSHIIPIWESNENKNGGIVIFRREDIAEAFNDLAMGLVGRCLMTQSEDIDLLNGFSIVNKKNLGVFKIWTSKQVDVQHMSWSSDFSIDPSEMKFEFHQTHKRYNLADMAKLKNQKSTPVVDKDGFTSVSVKKPKKR